MKSIKQLMEWGLTKLEAVTAKSLAKAGMCLHPAKLITTFHFSIPLPEGGYEKRLRGGFICELCSEEVRLHRSIVFTGSVEPGDALREQWNR